MTMERRYRPALDLRGSARGDAFTARGHWATFNQPYSLGAFDEQIDPGAFDDAMREDEVHSFWNHNSDNVLGYTASGTLRLGKDATGPTSEIDFPKSAVREREALERGDVRKMSFGFRAIEDKWEELENGRELRTILRAKLFDVSPVALPANPHTDLSIAQRSRAEWRRRSSGTADARAARLREMTVAERTPARSAAPSLTREARARHLRALEAAMDARPGDSRGRADRPDIRGTMATSLHEASHALVAHVRGLAFESVSVDWQGGSFRAPTSTLRDPAVALAGAVGAGFRFNSSRPSESDVFHAIRGAYEGAAIDRARATLGRDPGAAPLGVSDANIDAHVDRGFDAARNILNRHSSALFRLARELQRRGTLTRADVRRIIGPTA